MCALSLEPSRVGLNLGPAKKNCHPGVSRAGQGIDVCTARRKDVKLEDFSASARSFVDAQDLAHGVVRK